MQFGADVHQKIGQAVMGPPLFGHPCAGCDEYIEVIEFGSRQQTGAHDRDGSEMDWELAVIMYGCSPVQGR